MTVIIAAMVEDVLREGSGEIVDSEAVRKAISRKTAVDYKNYLKSQIGSQWAIFFLMIFEIHTM